MKEDSRSTPRRFERVLVSNRGEIAVRILRACREAGVETATIYSEADRGSPHVWMADRALEVGPPPARDSYLRIDRILEAANRMEADAVHPGYGFLAENAEFAQAVTDSGRVWVGPPPESIRAMGEKTAARKAMRDAGVPVIPGSLDPVADAVSAAVEAARVGYPVLLKASSGGGGKGMRVVREEAGLEAAFRAAASEAQSSFGDASVYVEKYLPEARHVEIQVLADEIGNTIHLGERECSLQRRHQKILEETPAPGLSAATRAEMGRVAVRAANAVGYTGAGTVEFMLAPDGEFFFLEMNTRLQVEHPVTEAVTGLDLVRLQLGVAHGRPLPIEQEDVVMRGHAIECRIAAEDPASGFLPSTGTVTSYREPSGPGTRFDSGIAAGVTVTPYYDPLLAKCVSCGPTRREAIERMERALEETEIGGITTNIAFQRALLDDPGFREGRVHTTYLEHHAESVLGRMARRQSHDAPLAAALAAWSVHRGAVRSSDRAPVGTASRWRNSGTWLWYR